jgi:hypothetical protein
MSTVDGTQSAQKMTKEGYENAIVFRSRSPGERPQTRPFFMASISAAVGVGAFSYYGLAKTMAVRCP